MKSADKVRLLLFTSLGILAFGIGFMNGHAQEYKAAQAKSKLPEIEVKDGMVEFGLYPQTVIASDDDDYENIKSSSHDGIIYTYKNNKYTYVSSATPCSEGGGVFSNGKKVYTGLEYFFKWEPIRCPNRRQKRKQSSTGTSFFPQILMPHARSVQGFLSRGKERKRNRQ